MEPETDSSSKKKKMIEEWKFFCNTLPMKLVIFSFSGGTSFYLFISIYGNGVLFQVQFAYFRFLCYK